MTLSFFAPTTDSATHAALQQTECHSETSRACRTTSLDGVGTTEAELDAHIRDLGRLMEKAHTEGERDTAIEMQTAMYAAIRSRSLRHQAAMHQRIDDACYFSSDEAHA